MMKKSLFNPFFLMLLGIGVVMSGCKKEDAAPEDENELITTVQLKFTDGTNVQTFQWRDIDGDGGAAPTIQNIALKANKTYKLDVSLLDESKTPAEDITAEVQEESDEHLLVFTPSPAALMTYTYGDKDAKNLPIGITGSLKTAAAGTGTLQVVLRHQPPVNGVAQKNGTATPGSTDVDVTFNVTVSN
jgi:hypothetical protein